jgi:hypothetical protein
MLTIQDKFFKDGWHLNDDIDSPFVRKGGSIKATSARQTNEGVPSQW